MLKTFPFFSIQIIWFTALFPYFVMFTLLVRAVTLEGAGEGLLLYVTPDWSKLYTSECWIDSATQIFFAYSIGNKINFFHFFINSHRCILAQCQMYCTYKFIINLVAIAFSLLYHYVLNILKFLIEMDFLYSPFLLTFKLLRA
jgi:hypothetical protein